MSTPCTNGLHKLIWNNLIAQNGDVQTCLRISSIFMSIWVSSSARSYWLLSLYTASVRACKKLGDTNQSINRSVNRSECRKKFTLEGHAFSDIPWEILSHQVSETLLPDPPRTNREWMPLHVSYEKACAGVRSRRHPRTDVVDCDGRRRRRGAAGCDSTAAGDDKGPELAERAYKWAKNPPAKRLLWNIKRKSRQNNNQCTNMRNCL